MELSERAKALVGKVVVEAASLLEASPQIAEFRDIEIKVILFSKQYEGIVLDTLTEMTDKLQKVAELDVKAKNNAISAKGETP